MSTPTRAGFRPAATQPGLSAADRAAHDASTFVRRPLAADDHGKTKDPLPSRPRGPHPYRTAVAS